MDELSHFTSNARPETRIRRFGPVRAPCRSHVPAVSARPGSRRSIAGELRHRGTHAPADLEQRVCSGLSLPDPRRAGSRRLLEHHDGRIIGIEVKASSSISGTDFRHLEHLREKAGERFHSGVALYAGTQILSFGDRLLATPIDSSGKAPWSVEVIREIEPALCDPDHGAPRASVVC